ncbi:hypothetical protein FC83_GL002510 [Agrilactobacillus composti DSM 18527 = JCM 14202]|uniref:5-bromo-4-chloroindolyl phosphate hydrolysis protein n=1 Tax=Agrilactobacillus composti DSM 18527 = JCM 14202 TaxID=1423734 RepID=X0PDI9_9LACO|nr:5-bromo-4-chloroindolyl phosphate hydrolysis family protein [Agrilactobacillus composti]KRM36636.1 hypothetical protein FC83_GL002510 [Agrilactobacillus composti DSM 18527 = JCM 14202]GAF39028.1 5-bromo-4-chloroindolyl phosphate hydrolysis protein [Agrilactobacillus composti DSM 18527 = JCM 14202]
MNNRFKNTLIGAGGVLVAGFVLSILTPMPMMGMHHGLTRFFLLITMIALAIFIVTLPFYLIARHQNRQQPATPDLTDKLNHKLLDHYQKAGLSDSDIVFFRKTMASAEQQIRKLNHNIETTPKLKAIDLNLDMVKVSKSMFAAIVKEPQRLSEASDFLYRHLPTLVNLTDRYIEISHHEVKTTDTWEVLAKSLEVIKNLGTQIREDYATFVADDLDEMHQEMSAAQDSFSTAQKDALKMNEALQKVRDSYEKDKENH